MNWLAWIKPGPVERIQITFEDAGSGLLRLQAKMTGLDGIKGEQVGCLDPRRSLVRWLADGQQRWLAILRLCPVWGGTTHAEVTVSSQFGPTLAAGQTAWIVNRECGKFSKTLVLLYPLPALQSAVQIISKSKTGFPYEMSQLLTLNFP
ncbi:hypothetical protein Anapl_14534 [Anas platyrhynchos]|uniref:Uncharacterized protein n=1 Tax=Anas platyrhynchos TaxID=8839 RepID=R0KQL7_ANAPL|nr:hypothetical protein Anapl_14534 [Anas platyrhynchos]